MFSAAKKPLSSPMKSGQRLAEADPTVPMTTVSAARTGAAAISMSKPASAHSSFRLSRMTTPPSLLSLPRRSRRRGVLQLRAIVPRDFRAGRLPDLLVPADVFQRGVERADAIGHAGQIGMHRDMHHASGGGALAIERIELPADRILEIRRRHVGGFEGLLVVDVVAVRQRDELFAARDRHQVGLIVVGTPVRDIFAAGLGEQIERAPRLLQPGTEPADWTLAARTGDGLGRVADDLRLLLGRPLVEAPGIALVVPHPLPPPHPALLDDLGVMDADVAVERDGRADVVAVEHLHQPEHADAVAIITDGPGRDIRNFSRSEAAGTRLEREELDVGNDPQCDARAAGPVEPRPTDDRRVGKWPIGTRFHRAPVQLATGLSRTGPANGRQFPNRCEPRAAGRNRRCRAECWRDDVEANADPGRPALRPRRRRA